jgi:hypothetical protein
MFNARGDIVGEKGYFLGYAQRLQSQTIKNIGETKSQIFLKLDMKFLKIDTVFMKRVPVFMKNDNVFMCTNAALIKKLLSYESLAFKSADREFPCIPAGV